MTSARDHRHLFLAELSDEELSTHLDALRQEEQKLERQLQGDRTLAHSSPLLATAQGKLAKRLARTRVRASACRHRRKLAEAEVRRRSYQVIDDWDEPTLPDGEAVAPLPG
jgi:hypothetical protein